ncbi:MAG: RNA chaperone Hfq [Acidobacteriota bacterium]|nr:MAG: RNA chaperone Hfq [Acidobacteriota bacterium]
MTESQQDLQVAMLTRLRNERVTVAVWLVSGKRLVGKIKGFERFTVVLEHGGADHLVFKHAVATIGPARD